MPRQPLYNDGSQVRTDPGSAQQIVAPRGVSVDSDALLGAIDPALLDSRGAAAEGRGFAALGQGVASLGDDVLRLAATQARVLNIKRVNEARNAMIAAEAQLTAAIEQEPDETRWPEITQKVLTEAPSAWMRPDLSPDARDEIENLTQTWKTRVAGEVVVKGARKTRTDVDADMHGQWQTAVGRGQLEEAKAINARRVAGGFITEGEGAAYDMEAERGVEIAQKRMKAESLNGYRNNVIEMSKHMPPEQVKGFIESGGFQGVDDPSEKEMLKNEVDRVARDGTAALAQSVSDGIAKGDIWNEYELDATYGNSPWMSPALRQSFLDDIQKWDARKADEAKEGPAGVQNFIRSYRDALAWKPELHSEQSAIELADKIATVRRTVPNDLAGEVTQLLHQKFGTKPPEMEVRKEVERMVTKTISAVYDRQLDPLKKKATKLMEGEPGSAEATSALEAYKKKELQVIEDQARVEMKMNDWYQRHPDATPEAALKELNRVLPEGSRVRRMQSLYEEPAAGAQGDIGDAGDEGEDGSFSARATGYFPVSEDNPNHAMQGGYLGAAEWHGKPVKQERLYTLDQYRRGEAPYVSVAMDNSPTNPLPYGTILESPDFPGIPFRVMDTGIAFNGKAEKEENKRRYGGAKGLGRIDIARDNKSGAWSKENNRRVRFRVKSLPS